jgi:tRNA pseudouridine13 synthase
MPYALGVPQARGRIRSSPEDFQVDEVLGFEPDGEGEQVLLHVRKRGSNTDWLAGELARFAGVPARDVGYAGLKDRHALTSQWFSVPLGGRADPDWRQLESADLQLLGISRHGRKLQRGDLQGNRFRLRVRQLSGVPEDLEQRLEHIRWRGFPNYFGEQRFGHGYANLQQAEQLFAGRLKGLSHHRRGLYLSAVRSQIFNQVLAARTRTGNWDRALPGDLLLLELSQSWFPVGVVDAAMERRIEALELHPTGPLWGSGFSALTGEARDAERAVTDVFSPWCKGLEQWGLRKDRRALRAVAKRLSWSFPEAGVLQLEFQLQAGSYATVLLREVLGAGIE